MMHIILSFLLSLLVASAQAASGPCYQQDTVGCTLAGPLTVTGVPTIASMVVGGPPASRGPGGLVDTTSTVPAWMVQFNKTYSLTGGTPSSVTSNLRLEEDINGGPNYYVWGVSNVMYLNSTSNAQNIGLASSIFAQTGRTASWLFYGQYVDTTGLPKTSSNGTGMELDHVSNGPEGPNTYFAPAGGAYQMINWSITTYQPPVWAANTAYALGTAVQPSPANGFTYVVTVAGTSGGTQPTWPTSAGTVTDGSVTWQYGTTVYNQASRLLGMATDANSEVATAIFLDLTFYDAALDMTYSTMDTTTNPNAAAIRLAPNMPIDFSGGHTSPTLQNVNTILYSSTDHAIEYRSTGTPVFAVSTGGAVGIGGLNAANTMVNINSDGAGIGINLFGTGGGVGLNTSNGNYVDGLRMAVGQQISFTTSDGATLAYSGTGFNFNVSGSTILKIGSTGILTINGTAGVSCTGTPTSSFATVGGVVTHC